uniref:Expansin-B5-like n=2 Tax=Nicotiana TaxID=4085 RepID=A0A1S4BC72_TOBAC|nr:PREDICTED: expansin-B5-like [Nicotiana sylvestris]XP_016486426.1 PREDICTED: expansin-B5-like [Nicotiana tabacum]
MGIKHVEITVITYHPQYDGQAEVVNICLETYLRCFCAEDPTGWLSGLPMVEYCQLFNSSLGGSGFSSAVATWYGNATGAGSTGGACGLEDGVAKSPYNAMITAGNQVLFRYGFGYGACYQVRAVACKYKTNIMFKVDKGSNRFFFAVAIEAENGDGALSLVEIKTTNSNKWIPMQQMFGATWCVHINPNTQKPPFSLRLTSEYKHQIKANNIIPVGWQSRTIYKSNVNFPNKL